MSTIDIASRTVDPDDLPVGGIPFEIERSPDSSQMWVANLDSGGASIIDVATRTVVPTMVGTAGGPAGIAFTPCRAPTPSNTTVPAVDLVFTGWVILVCRRHLRDPPRRSPRSMEENTCSMTFP